MTEVSQLLDSVVEIAIDAGKAVMEVYESGDFDVEIKDDNSPLTRADTASDKVITDALKTLTPDIPILSEESAQVSFTERTLWERFWLIDPLDGTKEFIKKTNEFTVNIALIEKGIPVMGVVNAPALGLTYYASKGEGAFKRDASGSAKIRVAPGAKDAPPRVVASKTHKGPILEAFLTQLGTHDMVSMGSSLKFCLIAEGKADVYPRLSPTMEWDTAAAQAVVECAGGTVMDLDGFRLRYNKEDLHNPFFMASAKQSVGGSA